MPTVAETLSANRATVDAFLGAVDQAGGATWTAPPGPGKWSPAQVTQHVILCYEESAKLFAGKDTLFPVLPGLMRPVARTLLFNRVIKGAKFPPGARTNGPMNPAGGPASPAEARQKLGAAVAAFEAAAQAAAGSGGDPVLTTMAFGKVTLSDWVRFQDAHTRHHQRQLSR